MAASDVLSGDWTNQVGSALQQNTAAGWETEDGDMTVLDDTPYVAWCENDSSLPDNLPCAGPYLAYWNGSDWTVIGSPISNGVWASRFGTRVCTDGTDIYVVYLEAPESHSGSGFSGPAVCAVWKWDGSSWTSLGTVSAAPWTPSSFDPSFYGIAIDVSADSSEAGACYVALSDSVLSSIGSGTFGSRLLVAGFGTSTLGEVVVLTDTGDNDDRYLVNPLLDGAGSILALYYQNRSSANVIPTGIEVWWPTGSGSISGSVFQSDYQGNVALTSPITPPPDVGLGSIGRLGTTRYITVSVEAPTGGYTDMVMKAIDVSTPDTAGAIDSRPAHDYDLGAPSAASPAPLHGILVETSNFWVGWSASSPQAGIQQLDRQCPGLPLPWQTTVEGNTAWISGGNSGNPVLSLDAIWRYVPGIAGVVNQPICRECEPCGGGLHVWHRS